MTLAAMSASTVTISKYEGRFRDAYSHFSDLLTLAEEYTNKGDLPAAVGLAQVAARYAHPGNVGLFASPRLERLLLNIGRQIPQSSVGTTHQRNNKSRNVLHVLSYAQPIGGDSRFAWRWILEDRNNRHSVAITTQSDLNGRYEIPEVIRSAAEDSGGFLRGLNAPTSKPLDQASELRSLCQDMDIVVLHLYPYDIIPVLALAAGCGSIKTLFVNHADHIFWVGASVANLVVHLRKQQQEFLRDRRGLRSDLSSQLPIPLGHVHGAMTSEEAKRALGYAPDVVILLTIATPFKYRAPGETAFLDLVSPIVHQFPKTVLIAIGPEQQGEWRSAYIQTNGRIVACGRRWDTDVYYAAADVYLDSVPFSSITSLLEAGSRGIPLLGYRQLNPDLELLGPGAPGLEHTMEVANDVESYRALLRQYICDVKFRKQCGRRVQTQILSLHTGSNWLSALNDVYEKAEQDSERCCLMADKDTFGTSALNLSLLHLYGDKPFSMPKLIGQYIGVLPYRSRYSITWRLHRRGFGLSFLNLLPRSMSASIRHVGRWTKRTMKLCGSF